ncbi:MAG: hypothetical protein WDZ94_01775 [Patescibacteria group bacterium]
MPTNLHKYLAIIPITIEDLSGEIAVEQIPSIVKEEIVRNIDHHADQMVVIPDVESEETK